MSDKKTTKKEQLKKTATKKSEPKKSVVKKSTKATAKSTVSKKTATKKSTVKKASTKTATTKKTVKALSPNLISLKTDLIEYYDLPYRYNETIVTLLYQNPDKLFVYWDISDNDILNFKEKYGEDFLNTTTPVLRIYNKTMDYSFDVQINDFANSWYIPINDENCKYYIELYRAPKDNPTSENFVYITSSNNATTPVSKSLANDIYDYILFKNIKNNNVYKKDVSSFKHFSQKDVELFYNKFFKFQANSFNGNPSSDFK